MSRYGRPLDYLAGLLGVVATLGFAYAWQSGDMVAGGSAAAGMVAAVGIALSQQFGAAGKTRHSSHRPENAAHDSRVARL